MVLTKEKNTARTVTYVHEDELALGQRDLAGLLCLVVARDYISIGHGVDGATVEREKRNALRQQISLG